MVYKYLVLKSNNKVCKLDFNKLEERFNELNDIWNFNNLEDDEIDPSILNIGYNDEYKIKFMENIVNIINKFFNNDKNARAISLFGVMNLYNYDNMYIEDADGNLVSLNDYVNIVQVIGYNKVDASNIKYFSKDKNR
jgi:hypothetical protein